MKLTAGILALIVLMLTLQPAFAYFEKAGEAENASCNSHCCGNDSEVPEEENEPDPCSDFCNPFLKCGGCAASTIEFLNYSLQRPGVTGMLHIVSAQKLFSQFAPDFWQPPKLA